MYVCETFIFNMNFILFYCEQYTLVCLLFSFSELFLINEM